MHARNNPETWDLTGLSTDELHALRAALRKISGDQPEPMMLCAVNRILDATNEAIRQKQEAAEYAG